MTPSPDEKPPKMKAVDKRRSIAVKWTHGMATEVKCRCGRTGIVVFCMGADALSKQFKVKVLEPRP